MITVNFYKDKEKMILIFNFDKTTARLLIIT